MILAQAKTWPAPLLEYLASERERLLAHVQCEREAEAAYRADIRMAERPPNPYRAARMDAEQMAIELLQSTTLRGWHCTRLTKNEVEHITAHGIQPPNLQILQGRIRRVQADGMLEDDIAQRLMDENNADDSSRKGVIWFCFYEPRFDDQSGTERLFQHWGGEALYRLHRCDARTGKALRSIGRPCLIEADVPVSSFGRYTYLGKQVVCRYLLDHGCDTGEDWKHDDRTHEPLPASNIVRLVFHGEREFAALTGCDLWSPPLGS